MQVAISVLRVLLFVTRPRTYALGNIPNSVTYRNVEQYPNANHIPGVLILEIDAPIYFANAGYLRERYTTISNFAIISQFLCFFSYSLHQYFYLCKN